MLTLAALLAVTTPSALVAAQGAPDSISAVSYRDVSIGGAFWGPRLAILRDATLAANRHQCDITGRIANFEKAARKIKGDPKPGEFEGLLFNDSDVYKMMEGWAYILGAETDTARKDALDKELDALIAKVAAAQHPDGYIDTYYTLKVGIERRHQAEENDHETYCMGHLIEAGVAHFEATGKKNLLDVATKAADYLVGLYQPDKFTAPSGHQEVELALVKLSRATGQDKYVKLANFIMDQRGKPHRKLDGKVYGPWGDYAQDHKPVAEQTEAAGHAVRAGYLYSGMADLARLGRAEYKPALDSLWEDIVQRRVFVTGGIGPSGHNEGFTVPYDIPTASAYQETCASIALCLWAHRMFLLEGDAKYMEQFEKTLYNAALAGVSLDGKKFFYVNPLASKGGHQRSDWFGCACCPPNVLRFFGSLGDYVYAVKHEGAKDTLYINLFMAGKASVKIGGKTVEVEQQTDYPWTGAVRLIVNNTTGAPLPVALRLPPGGKYAPGAVPDEHGYTRTVLEPGPSVVVFDLPVAPTRVYSDPRVKASLGRAAIMRGPLVYAAESVDNDGKLTNVVLPPNAPITESRGADGTPILTAEGFRLSGGDDGGLYRSGPELTPAKLTLRPYFMWANRGVSQMNVWIPESAALLDPMPMKGLTITASYIGNGDGLDAMADKINPEKSGDGSVPRMTFWPHKGGSEWVQYSFDKPRKIAKTSVYWFDDTGVGECRVPKACTVEYLDGKDWKPVPNAKNGALGVKIDQFNTTAFDAVTTTGLRLKIDLPDSPKLSTGLLEWTFQ